MITAKQESILLKKIKSLTEMEFTMLMEEVAEHVQKNRWQHVIETTFAGVDLVDVDKIQDELDEMEAKKDELVDVIGAAINALGDIETIDDEQEKAIGKIIDNLSWSI